MLVHIRMYVCIESVCVFCEIQMEIPGSMYSFAIVLAAFVRVKMATAVEFV